VCFVREIRNLRTSLATANLTWLWHLASPGNMAKWQSGKLEPSGQMLATLAKLALDDERFW
jgi:hypothetical protein